MTIRPSEGGAAHAVHRVIATACLIILAIMVWLPTARAGVTISLQPNYNENGGSPYYLLFASLNTNDLTANPIGTFYYVWSAHGSTNSAVSAQMDWTNGNNSNIGNGYGDFGSLLSDVTNVWTLMTVNGTTTNLYHFSFSGFPSNELPETLVTSPTNHETGVSLSPVFAWQGPTNYATLVTWVNSPDNSFYQSAGLPTNQTSWDPGVTLDFGSNYYINVSYYTNPTNIVASTPTNVAANAFPGWQSTVQLVTFDSSYFQTLTPVPNQGHLLVAQYTFDETNNVGEDSSLEDNGIECGSFWGNSGHVSNTNAVDGGWAMQFFGESSMTPCDRAFRDWQAAFLGSFSVSAWINTTNKLGNDGDSISDNYLSGQAVIYMDQNTAIPIGLTGSKVAFATSDGSGGLETLHSATSVTTGQYVHVVVTRDAVTGLKKIYVNGVLDSTETGVAGRLGTDATWIALGSTFDLPYSGLVDEVQIYRGVLEDQEVAALYADPSQTIPDIQPGLQGTLVAHYTFDDTNHLGVDSSGNIFDLNFADNYNLNFSENGSPNEFGTNDAAAGTGSVCFNGNGFLGYETTPPEVLSALWGDYSVAAWIKTTEDIDSDGDPAYEGAGIVAADVAGTANDSIPLALTGGQAATFTGNPDTTVNSTYDINDGSWHHVVITRQASSGTMQIYIDGNFNTSGSGSTSLLTDPRQLTIGALVDASQSEPDFAGPYGNYVGELDDLQIYSTVLDASNVMFLYDNPGQAVGQPAAVGFNFALNTAGLTYSTSGDSSWFTESAVSLDGSAAASGVVTNYQTSTLSTTITGPGSVSFHWETANTAAGGYNFGVEFDLDGNYGDSLSGDNSWTTSGPYYLYDSNPHTFSWTASANGSTDPGGEAYLDEITVTNLYPPSASDMQVDGTSIGLGYPTVVAQVGSNLTITVLVTANPPATYQWYQNGRALPGQTSASLVLNDIQFTNSGSYEFIATSSLGNVQENPQIKVYQPTDLIPLSLSYPTTVSSDSLVHFMWTVTNTGPGAVSNVFDYLYFSEPAGAPYFLQSQAEYNQESEYVPGGSSYTVSTNLRFPNIGAGTYTLLLDVNANGNVIEPTNNDWLTGPQITVVNPDMQPGDLSLSPTTYEGGAQITLSYNITNNGPGILDGAQWYDQVYISKFATLDTNAVAISVLDSTGIRKPSLGVGDWYSTNIVARVPGLAAGNYYLILAVDNFGFSGIGSIWEANESNNAASVPIHITEPDLAITNIDAPPSASAYQTLTVDYQVVNQGDAGATNGWNDAIYISRTNVLDYTATAINEGSIFFTGTLLPGQAYSNQTSIRIPALPAGNYFLLGQVDTGGNVVESDLTNNVLVKPIQILNGDLEPISFKAPPGAVAESTISLSWTVTNIGAGTEFGYGGGDWEDIVVISTNSTFDTSATFLGSFRATNILEPDDTYTVTNTITTPNLPNGTYYLYVWVDPPGYAYESDETNNTLGAKFVISTPDLAITTLTNFQTTLSSQEPIDPIYVVTNMSPVAAPAGWSDRLYLSSDGVIDGGSIVFPGGVSGNFMHGSNLLAFSSYTNQFNVNVPGVPAGDYYMIADADADQFFVEPYGNNTMSAMIHVLNPDLAVTNIGVPPVVSITNLNQPLSITWTVVNQGAGTIYSPASWLDEVSLSPTNVLTTNRISLSYQSEGATITPGQAYTASNQVTLPNFIAGNYYILVQVNVGDAIFETDYTNDVLAVPIELAIPPLPILAVQSVSSPATALAGQTIQVNWVLTNSGSGDLNGTFTDRVYLGSDAAGDNAVEYGDFAFTGTIPAHSSVQRHENITLPLNTSGPVYAGVQTDVQQQIFQFTNRPNETLFSSQPTVVATSTADLAVTDEVLFTNVWSSQEPISPVYIASNVGTETAPPGWVDRIYLSSNGVVDAHSIKLSAAYGETDFPQTSALQPGASYTNLLNLRLPGVPAGDYFVIADADATEVFAEPNFANNVFSVPVHILNPDLAATNFDTPASVTITGFNEPITVDWSVVNEGLGAIDSGLPWNDNVYISKTNVLDTNAVYISGQGRNMDLGPGESYDGFTQAELPNFIEGNYYLLLSVNDGGAIFETNHANNVIAEPLQIQIPPLPILGIVSVSASPDAWSGAQLEVTWALTNSGPGDLNTNFYDTIFLATDAAGDNKQSFGNFSFSGSIPSHSSITRRQLITLPITMQGTFWAVVTADAGDEVFQYTNEANETLVASQPTTVHFTPVPDLATIKVQAATNVFSSEQVLISWIVTNAGAGPTRAPFWYDTVYLSASTNYGDPTYWNYLGAAGNPSFLAPGDTYSNSLEVTVPLGLNGTFYFVIDSDEYNAVYETNKANNVGASGPVFISLTQTPDLQVGVVVPPHVAFSGQPVSVYYSVTNYGLGQTRPSETNWSDAIYISTNTIFDQSATLLGSFPHVGGLTPDEGYAATHTVTLPVGISGTYYFYGFADILNNVFEGAFEDNNFTIAAYPTTVELTPPPDLAPGIDSVPAVALANHTLTVGYSVTNIGLSAPPNNSWVDSFYISQKTNFDSTAILLDSASVAPPNFGAGASYSNQFSVTVPGVVEGSYYVYIYSDPYEQVFELDRSNNVARSASPVLIEDRPPDLAPLYLASPSSVNINSTFSVSWGVTNQGWGDTAGASWTDDLVLSENDVLGAPSDLILQTANGVDGVEQTETLPAPGFYSVSNQVFNLPGTVGPGQYKLFLVVNENNGVYETNTENNVFGPVPITVTAHSADLAVTNATAPINVDGCTNITVTYSVANEGDRPPSSSIWYDGIYLTRTGVVDDTSTLLAYPRNATNLLPGQSYTQTNSVVVPADSSGTYYITVVADYLGMVEEAGAPGNNAYVVSPPLEVSGCPAPDLEATNLVFPATADEGQNIALTWTVKNIGGSAAVMANGYGPSFDAAYLSLEQAFDPSQDIFLGYVNSPSNTLAPGQSYTTSASFPIPEGLSGPYYVIIDASHNRVVDERGSYINNLAISPQAVQVELLPPVDLVAGVMTIPVNAGVGQAATITYTVKNNGSNTALGQWLDSVYIAPSTNYVVGDPLFATVQHTGDLAPGASYSDTVTGILPGVPPGDYYVIVRSDIRNHLGEGDNPHKVAASLNSVTLTIPQLTLGAPATGYLASGLSAYYSFYATNGETIHLKLSTPAPLANNQLFVAENVIPGTGNFQYAANDPFVAGPELFMPITNTGTYYVTLTSSYSPTTNNYSLLANVLPFTVATVQPQLVGDSAPTTFEVQGAAFDSGTLFELDQGTNVLPAYSVEIVNPSLAYVTFVLGGLADGQASLAAIEFGGQSNEISSVLTNSVTIEPAAGPIADASINGPLIVPSGTQIVAATYLYGNSGDEDLDAPLIIVRGDQGSPISLDRGNFTTNQIHMLGRSLTGPPGTMRPQIEDSFVAYSQGAFHTSTYPVLDSDATPLGPTDWTTIQAAIRPPGISDAGWINFWASIQPRIQPTWGGYVAFLQNVFASFPPQVREVQYVMGYLYTNSPYFIPTRTFSGTLLGAQDGTPQANMEVDLMSANSYGGVSLAGSAVTDDNGRFTIDYLNPGVYTAGVTNETWDMNRDGQADTNAPTFDLTQGTDVSGVNLYVLQTPEPTLVDNDENPTLLADSQGFLHAFWQHNGMIFHSLFNNGNWVEAAPINGNQSISTFAVASAPNLLDGATPGVLVAWSEDDPTNGIDLLYSVGIRTNGVFAWSDPKAVVSNPEQNTSPSIVINQKGQAVISYLTLGVEIQDDSDVYYNIVNAKSGQLMWSNSLAELGAEVVAEATTAVPQDGAAFNPGPAFSLTWQKQFKFFTFGSKLLVGFNAALEGAISGCGATITAKGGASLDLQSDDYGAKISGELSGKYEWAIDEKLCNYKFSGATINMQAAIDVTYKNVIPRAIEETGNLIGKINPPIGLGVTLTGAAVQAAINRAKKAGLLLDNNLIVHGDVKLLGLDWKNNPPVNGFTAPNSISEAQIEVSAGLEFTARLAGQDDFSPIDEKSPRKVDPTDFYSLQTPSFVAGGKMGLIIQLYPNVGWKSVYLEGSVKLQEPPNRVWGPLTLNASYNFNPVFNPFVSMEGSSDPFSPRDTNATPFVFDPTGFIGTGNVYGTNAVLSTIASDIYNDGAPSLALDATGAPYQAWYKYGDPTIPTNGSQIYVADYNGHGWNDPLVIPNTDGLNSYVSAITDGTQHRLAAWVHCDIGQLTADATEDEYYAIRAQTEVDYSTFDGTSWSAPQPVAVTPGANAGLQLRALQNGDVLAVWVTTDSSQLGHLMTSTWNGSAWSTAQEVTSGSIVTPAAQEFGGNVYLLWDEIVTTNNDTAIYSSVESSGVWSKPAPFQPVYVASAAKSSAQPQGSVAPRSPTTDNILSFLTLSPYQRIACCKCGLGGSTTVIDVSSGACGYSLVEFDPVICHKLYTFRPCVAPPHDPNEIVGPIGFGPNKVVSAGTNLDYTVYFENDPTNAAAPAQTVSVTMPLDPNFDVRTFRLGTFGFGGLVFAPPANSAFFETNIDLTATSGFIVEVAAGVDVVNNQAFWTFTTIDPATGDTPLNPYLGFLPRDTNSPNGEGFVSCSIQPLSSTPIGTTVGEEATVVFNGQPPLATGFTYNELEVGSPSSAVAPLPSVTFNPEFTVSWSGQSAPGGDGIASYDIYVAQNNETFVPWLQGTALQSAQFVGQPGNSYSFYSVATDNSGNTQSAPTVADTTIIISSNVAPTINVISNIVVAPGAVAQTVVKAADTDGDQITFNLATGPLGATINTNTGAFRWTPSRTNANTTNLITVTATGNGVPPVSTNASFYVIVGDYLDLALGSTNVLFGESNSVPVTIASSDGATNLTITVAAPENFLTNLSVQGTATGLASASLRNNVTNVVITLTSSNGQPFLGNLQVAKLSFIATNAAAMSGIVSLPIVNITGYKPNGTQYADYSSQAGSVLVVADTPVLQDVIGTNLTRVLSLYGRLGTNYEVQFSTNLSSGLWQTLEDYTQSNRVINLNISNSAPIIFYRIEQR